MRAKEFLQIDEAMPALAAVGKAMGGMAAKAAGGIAKAGANAAKAVGATAVDAAQGPGKSMAAKVAQKNQDQLAKQLIKKGGAIPFPTKSGQAKEFKIDDVKGDEVTIINPDAKAKPEEPEKMVYKKKDVETVVKGLQQ